MHEASEADRELEQAQVGLKRANQLVRDAARQMISYAQIPTERDILYLFNDAIPSHESAQCCLSEGTIFRRGLHP